jgi:hypothetical protein
MSAQPRVNYIRHLNTFFKHVRKDDRLQANDVSLYMALFQIWNAHNFRYPFPIDRDETMQLCRIGSRSTYMKCMKRLDACGYIIYYKAAKKYAQSKITVVVLTERPTNTTQLSLFDNNDENKNGPHVRPKSRPRTKPNNGPHPGPESGHFNNKQVKGKKVESKEKDTHSKNNKNEQSNQMPATPEILQVLEYFTAAGHSDKEARKFYHHYQAIAWTLSGSPIKNWQAAADKWFENIKKAKNDTGNTQSGRLHVEQDKSYNNAL